MGGEGEFNLKVTKKEVVSPLLPLQDHWLPLSNLDLIVAPLDVSVYFCYNNNDNNNNLEFGSKVSVLKKALAQVLVSYYAFAGELVSNTVGEPELLCNNRGVDFVEASADLKLEDLDFYNPEKGLAGKLIPKKTNGILAVQATELKCGGLVVACTFDHRIADAYSANMFLVAWAEMAQSKPISVLPSFRKSLLNPQRPSGYHPSIDDMYVPITAMPPPEKPQPGDDYFTSRLYYISSDQINKIQSMAGSKNNRRTKLESFSAFLWQMVAKASVEDTIEKKTSKMAIVVDGRKRLSQTEPTKGPALSQDKKDDKEKSMDAYFGNVLSLPFGEKTIDELKEKPLSWVADSVHDNLVGAVTKEHFLGLINRVEARRPVPTLPKVICTGKNDGPALVVSSGQRFPVSKVDFGWGKPFLGTYHFPWTAHAGYVMPVPSPTENGDWVVYMYLMKGQLDMLEAEAAHVFKPLSFDYLNNLIA